MGDVGHMRWVNDVAGNIWCCPQAEAALLEGASVLCAGPGHELKPWVLAVPLALLALAGCSAVYTSVLVSGAVPAGSAYARRAHCAAVEAEGFHLAAQARTKHGWNVVEAWLGVMFPVHFLLVAALHSPTGHMEPARRLLLARCYGVKAGEVLRTTTRPMLNLLLLLCGSV